MKIAMFSWESLHGFAAGGVAVHATELAAALERRGHEIHLFTRRPSGMDNYACIHGVHHHLIDQSSGSDFVHEIHNLNECMVDRFMQVTHGIGPFDLVHGHDWLTAEGMVQIKERWSLPGVFTVHSTEFGRNGNIYHDSGDPWRVSELERYGTYCANQVIVVSAYLKDEVMNQYQCPDWKMHVVHNGVNPKEFELAIDAGAVKARYGIAPLTPLILFTGRATQQKGPDLLLEAVPAVLREHPSAHVILAGDGDQRDALAWRIGELGLEECVHLLPRLPRHELVELVCACDTVAAPSRYEPFGIVVLEAWSAGKPVLVTVNGGPNEFVDQDGNGVKVAASPEGIAWGLNHLMNQWEHARWLGENGRKTVESRFTWDRIGAYTEGVYQHTLDA
ncbi:MAG: glycosyltransferase family 4 protein [Planctomycetota bacterium]|jgi:glycosyltransferase involved in cell wall biosynthesis